MRSRRAGTWALGAAGALLAIAVALAGLTVLGMQAHHQSDRQTFCFAEWCVTPAAIRPQAGSTEVDVRVSSQAQRTAQRPDHPQAWLAADGRGVSGGPQPALDRRIAAGATYMAVLDFPTGAGAAGCFTFTVSEGGWPPFLGLGYAPSPFTETADWRLCATEPSA